MIDFIAGFIIFGSMLFVGIRFFTKKKKNPGCAVGCIGCSSKCGKD